MIEYIKGEIVELSPTRVVIDCAGIGYELNISVTTYSEINGCESVKIYTYEVIREDAHLLYGFSTREERELFLQLISVSGVGPNTARLILSSLPPNDLVNIISSGDDVSLTRVKGIGNKTAQRIVVDLRNKVKAVDGATSRQGAGRGSASELKEGAVAALVMLGFQKSASLKVVEAILKSSPSLKVEQVIKEALKML
jgi:Holliday junction DNA helicase RuvA